jgi:hypothetical protein
VEALAKALLETKGSTGRKKNLKAIWGTIGAKIFLI